MFLKRKFILVNEKQYIAPTLSTLFPKKKKKLFQYLVPYADFQKRGANSGYFTKCVCVSGGGGGGGVVHLKNCYATKKTDERQYCRSNKTTVETELKVTQSALDVHMGCTPFVKD